jgi:signal transduction histidine kinase
VEKDTLYYCYYHIRCCILLLVVWTLPQDIQGAIPDTLRQLNETIVLTPNLLNYRVDTAASVWILPKHSATITDAIRALSNHDFFPQCLNASVCDSIYPPLDRSGYSEFWIAIHVTNESNEPYPLALRAYGSGGDSVWTLDDALHIIQRDRISTTSKVRDHTGYIKTADLDGIGLLIGNKEKTILIRIHNYRFGHWDLPRLFDARTYGSLYYEENILSLVIFGIFTGIFIALLVFYLIQYIQLPKNYLLWNILYIICIYLPYLDGANWVFMSGVEVAYLWFNWKIFNIVLRIVLLIFLINSLLIQKVKWFDAVKYWIVTVCALVFVVDRYFILKQQEPESLAFYFFINQSSILIYVLVSITLIKQRDFVSKIITVGILVVVLTEVLSYVLPNPLDDIIPQAGVIAQLFCFAYAIYYKLKLKEVAAIELEQNHKLLQLENANIQHALRQEVAHDIHDEVGSTLTKLSLAAQWAKINPQEKLDQTRFYDQMVEDISQVSQQVRDLVFSIHPGNDSFGELQSQVRTLSNEYLAKTEITLLFEMTEKHSDVKVASMIRRNILAIIREALHNIVKHSGADQVIIKLQMGTDLQYELLIKDNGRGFESEHYRTTGHGLLSMQSRAERIKSNIKFQSGKGAGTTIEMKGSVQT